MQIAIQARENPRQDIASAKGFAASGDETPAHLSHHPAFSRQ
jgi:hypothetical protein